jgi:tagatose 1,6-diphosphate aldolase
MLAIDQRGSLASALALVTGRKSQQVAPDELTATKGVIIKVLAPYASAVLTDPVYGYPQGIPHLPPHVGLLLAYEESGYTRLGPAGRERGSSLIEGWSAAQAQRSGADAVKLLVYYHPDASEEVRQGGRELVQRVGGECQEANLPFLLELVSYSLEDESTDTPQFAVKKPEVVIRSAAEFSQPRYHVDILKLEFPADLKWTRELSRGAFDGREREPVYDLAQVREFCGRLNEAAGSPWVILSAGVDISEFLVQVELATAAGASGFLCGRAIWKDAIGFYPDLGGMEEWLASQGAYNFARANAYAQQALPWFRHRKFTVTGQDR